MTVTRICLYYGGRFKPDYVRIFWKGKSVEFSLCAKLPAEEQFIQDTQSLVEGVFAELEESLTAASDKNKLLGLRAHISPGKMLRSRLGLALCPDDPALRRELVRAAAATEMVHTVTLFHDDVIDGASLRRSRPALWREVGATGAILLGDLLFSSAIGLLAADGNPRLVRSFIAKIRELSLAEVEHELLLRGEEAGLQAALNLARRKTGTLFAFIAECCAGADERQRLALSEAGSLLGAAYQLADDALDECGDEAVAGKTLGTDRKRRKFTLAQSGWDSEMIRVQMNELCRQALRLLDPWPELAPRLEQYIRKFLLPTWDLELGEGRQGG